MQTRYTSQSLRRAREYNIRPWCCLGKWSTIFSSLCNLRNTEAQFDHQFYDDILRHKQLLEENMIGPLYGENVSLSYTINRNEVEHAVFHATYGKTPCMCFTIRTNKNRIKKAYSIKTQNLCNL